MDEQHVRLLVRQAIARRLGAPAAPPLAPLLAAARSAPPAPASGERHPAAERFVILRPAGEIDCIIEPAVTCNHCGYCQCYGH
ncbi:MAG: hypothetical protein R2745_18325 [Vicinamibacterales bacterium]